MIFGYKNPQKIKGTRKRFLRGLQTSLYPPRLTCLDRDIRTLGAVKREIGYRLAHAGFLYSRIHGPAEQPNKEKSADSFESADFSVKIFN